MRTTSSSIRALALFLGACFALSRGARLLAQGESSGELLPDLTVDLEALRDWEVIENPFNDRTELRFSTSTPNVGAGPLVIRGVFPPNDDGTQNVVQRIFREGGGYTERDAGAFVFHGDHDHIHLEDWTAYRLRRVLGDGSPGEVIAESTKTSFCLADFEVYDDTLPNFSPVASFMVCDNAMQGISVGWTDLYSRTVEGQSIDVTDVPEGEYWLENEVDPDDAIVEVDEENNVVRTLVVLGDPPSIAPDRFEPNDSATEVAERPEAAPRSPNLGPTGPELVLDGLTIHSPGDEDFFRFYLPATGRPGDFVRLGSSRAGSELELRLLDSSNVVFALRVSEDGEATISLKGLGEGMYIVGARARDESALATYSLTLRVPRSAAPPRLDVIEPGRGNTTYPHALALYTVRWQAHDADGNRTWTRVWLHPSRDSLEGAHLFVGSQWTSGEAGRHTLNTAEISPGKYWVRCEITDGSTTSEGWSEGTLELVRIAIDCLVGSEDPRDCDGDRIDDECEIDAEIEPDCNRNGRPDACDVRDGLAPDENGDGVPDSCDVPFHRGDLNADGALNVSDAIFLLSWLFLGGRTPSCRETGDVDDDGAADIGDAVGLLNFLFRGGPPPAAPGPPGFPCGRDPPLPGQPQLGCVSYAACE